MLGRKIELAVAKDLGKMKVRVVRSGAAGSCDKLLIDLYGGQTKFVPVGFADRDPLMAATVFALFLDENGRVIHTVPLPPSFHPYKKIIFSLDKQPFFQGVFVDGIFDQFRMSCFGFPRKAKRLQPDSIQSPVVDQDTLQSSRSLYSSNTGSSSSLNSSCSPDDIIEKTLLPEMNENELEGIVDAEVNKSI